MTLPTRAECEGLFVKYKVPSNVKNHCFKVNEVALFLAKKLREKGIKLDLELIDRVSLLHDLFKPFKIPLTKQPKFKADPTQEEIAFWTEMKSKYSQELHETELFTLIFKDVYPKLAQAMQTEGEMSKSINKTQYAIEFQIVHYADWRVFVDDIIPFQQRIDDIFERYKEKRASKPKEFWDQFRADELKLEQNIFQHLDFSPDELKQKIEGN